MAQLTTVLPNPYDPLAAGVQRDLATAVAATDYSQGLAYIMAVVSAWAYAEPATFVDILGRVGIGPFDVTPFNVTNEALLVASQAYVLRSLDGRLAIVAFRGTRPLQALDWLVDGTVRAQPLRDDCTDLQVHGGFARNLEVIWPSVASVLGATPTLEALYFTGHSLGGAMAVLAAALAARTPPGGGAALRGIYTFGQPKVAAQESVTAFQREIGNRLFRHVYARDVVPQMPPHVTGDFGHFGRLYHSKKDRPWELETEIAGPSVWDPFDVVSLPEAFAGFLLGTFPALRFLKLRTIEDHFPAHYVEVSKLSARHQTAVAAGSGGKPFVRFQSKLRGALGAFRASMPSP